MILVLLTALGVGGATVLGALMGLIFKRASQRFANPILAFSAGIMLAASVFGLILPALESDSGRLLPIIGGIFCGALCMDILGRIVCFVRPNSAHLNRVFLFVAAIAIHNLPEGIAAGVGFGTGDKASAFMIACAIALQNIPEGMVIIAPMLSAGLKPGKTFLYALSTGLIEVLGTFLGYFAITTAEALLPFALSFAAGTMLFIICGEMIPEVCCKENIASSYSLLLGFCVMLIFGVIL